MELEFHQLERRYEALRRRDPERERRLVASIAERGQQQPIVVVTGEDGRLAIVDGYKRVRALQTLRQDTVLATRWELGEADALVLERLMRAGDADDALEQGLVLRELRERFALTEAELAERFDKSVSWVSRRLALLEALPAEAQESVRGRRIGAHAAAKYLVPLARANREECVALVRSLAKRAVTSREVASLYEALLSGSEQTRALVLRDPWLFLRAQAEAKQTKQRERTPQEVLLGEFGAVAGIAGRARRHLDEAAARMCASERRELRRAVGLARAETAALFLRCDKELGDAGPAAESHDPQAA